VALYVVRCPDDFVDGFVDDFFNDDDDDNDDVFDPEERLPPSSATVAAHAPQTLSFTKLDSFRSPGRSRYAKGTSNVRSPDEESHDNDPHIVSPLPRSHSLFERHRKPIRFLAARDRSTNASSLYKRLSYFFAILVP